MGGTCCKKNTEEEAITYEDDYFSNFYNNPLQNINSETDFLGENNKNLKIKTENVNSQVRSITVLESNDAKNTNTLYSNSISNEDNGKVNNISHINNDKNASDEINSPVRSTNKSIKYSPESKNSQYSKYNLTLIVKESKVQSNIDKEYKINHKGLVGSTKKDGVVTFGKTNEPIDTSIREDDVKDRRFDINFNNQTCKFLLKNPNLIGIFIKIDDNYILKDGSIISFGTNHIICHIVSNYTKHEKKDSFISKIIFKCIYGANKGVDK